MNIIAIDIGSTSMKFAVISLSKNTLILKEVVDTPDKIIQADKMKYEIDIQLIMDEVVTFIDKATKLYDIDSLYFSTQMHGYVYESRYTKNYVSWQDSRCEKEYQNQSILNKVIMESPLDIIETLGVKPKKSMGIINLYAQSLLDEKFDDTGELFSLGSYIISKLTGNNICHITNAAPMGIVNIKSKSINEQWIKHLGLSNIKYPTISNDYRTVCGNFTINNQTIKIFPDFGDQQISVLGTHAKDQELIFNMATAAQICCIDTQYENTNYEVRPYFDNKYLLTVTNLPSGRNLDVFYDFVINTVKETTGIEKTRDDIAVLLNSNLTLNDKVNSQSNFFDVKGGSFSLLTNHNFLIKNMLSALYFDYAELYSEVVNTTFKNYNFADGYFLGGLAYHNQELVSLLGRELNLNIKQSKNKFNAFNGVFKIALVNSGQVKSLNDTIDLHLYEGDI